MTPQEIRAKLIEPFPAEEIEWRVQSCDISNSRPWVMVIAFVQARAIQRRLDDIFGWDGWSDEYRTIDKNVICRLGVRTETGWIYKENGATNTDIEAFKGGISGALKRVAASGFGIGRYLYDLDEVFAKCQLEKPANMNGWVKAKTKDKKDIYWEIPKLPASALPSGYRYKNTPQTVQDAPQPPKVVSYNKTYICETEGCGAKVEQNVYDWSIKHFNKRILCRKCQGKAKEVSA